jgi:hypothetical protein
MIKKFKKKPVVIEAEQWFKNGDHSKDECYTVAGRPPHQSSFLSEGKIVRYYRTPDLDGKHTCKHCGDIMHNHGWVETLEGGHIVCPGDWIIKGISNEYYPCKPDIFEQTYDEEA